MLSRSPRWSDPLMFWFHVLPHCCDALLRVIVGNKCSWRWVLLGRQDGLNCPVSYILAWSPWWVGAHGGPWGLGWTRCLVLSSWVGWVWYFYHNHIIQIDICFPYWMSQRVYLWGLWLFPSCGRWSWLEVCWCVVPVVSSVDPPLYLALMVWLTWGFYLFVACGPWLLPFIWAYACELVRLLSCSM